MAQPELQSTTPPIDRQASYWDQWNRDTREQKVNPESERQGHIIRGWIEALGRRDLAILDVGCGGGWLCNALSPYGTVTGLDLSPAMIERAGQRYPQVRFIAGSISDCDLPLGSFDVIVTLEVLSHVPDQAAFMRRCADLLKPGGMLLLSTQNRPVYSRMAEVAPPSPDQIRHWVDASELRRLAAVEFRLATLTSICPRGNLGFLRLVNSPKLNRLLGLLLSEARIERLKERLFLGSTLMLQAQKRN